MAAASDPSYRDPAFPPWYEEAYANVYSALDDEVPMDLFTLLANGSAVSGQLTKYALAMARHGCNTLDKLNSMGEGEVRAMGSSIGMDPADVNALLAARTAIDPRFVMPEPLDPPLDYFMTQVEMLFLQTDKDGNGELDRSELVRIFKSNENVQAMLDQAWIDQDRSGTLDLKELKALFTVIWHQFGEDTCFELLRRIRKTGY